MHNILHESTVNHLPSSTNYPSLFALASVIQKSVLFCLTQVIVCQQQIVNAATLLFTSSSRSFVYIILSFVWGGACVCTHVRLFPKMQVLRADVLLGSLDEYLHFPTSYQWNNSVNL